MITITINIISSSSIFIIYHTKNKLHLTHDCSSAYYTFSTYTFSIRLHNLEELK